MSGGLRAALSALIAAVEAAASALASFAVIVVPVLLVWWIAFDLGAEPDTVIAVAAGVWQLGHLVPLEFALSPELALSFGLEPAELTFEVSLVPLGITVLTGLLAGRAGWRLARQGGTGGAGLLGGALGFAVAALVFGIFAAPVSAWPLAWSIVVPALIYGLVAAVLYCVHAILREDDWWHALKDRVRAWSGFDSDAPRMPRFLGALPAQCGEALRLGFATLCGLVALAGLGTALAIVLGYVDIVTLSQSLHPDFLGLLVLFVMNLILLPLAWVWGIAWFAGSGFAIGGGTSVTPFETLLGPLPAFPLLGAIPQGWGWAGGLAPALVVLVAVSIGVVCGGQTRLRAVSLGSAILIPLLAAIFVGLAVVGLSALASGAFGPERLALSGPKPWLTGGLIALECAVGLVPGALARRLDLDRFAAGRARALSRVSHTAETGEVDPGAEPVSLRETSNADQETVPLEPLPRRLDPGLNVVASAAAEPDHDPGDLNGSGESNGPGGSSGPSELGNPGELSETNESGEDDELLRAFSWESEDPGAASRTPRESTPRPRDWRSLWRKR